MRLIFSNFLLVLLLFLNFASFKAQSGIVKGTIVDKRTNSIVEFATVSLYTLNDSSLITGAITDSLGHFEIQELAYDKYYAKIGFIGYKTKILDGIEINKSKPIFDISTFSLTSFSENMDEFNVVAEKELVEIKIDKTVYNVSKDPNSQGGNGLDALKNLPSVDVDIEDNISLRNDNSVTVLVDGKPSPIPASQLLKNIPASLIEKIEVITNPSAKYNPEGMSGIINVVLKKEKAVGFNGNFNGGYGFGAGNLPRYNGSLSLNYRKKKWNVYGRTGLFKGGWGGKGITNRVYTTNDSIFYQDLNFERRNSYSGINYSAGVDYFVNDANTVYIEVDGWNGGNNGLTYNQYDFFDDEKVLQNYSNRITDLSTGWNGFDVNIGWQSEFDEDGDHTLDFDFDFSRGKDHSSNQITEQFYLANDVAEGIPQIQNINNPANDYDFEGAIDYVLPITDSLEFEVGIIATITDSKREFNSASSNSLNILSPDVNLNNEITFNQNLNAAYFTLGKQFKKVGIKVGTRFENVTTKINLINTNEEFTKNYNSFFPSAYLTYKLIKKHELKLSYSRRINRPSEWQMNPFPSYTDPFSLRIGNPNLNPEYINVYELGYMFQGDKLTLTPNAYIRHVVDKKTNFSELNSQGIVISTYNNLGKLLVKGFEFNIRYSPFDWWRLNGTVNYSQSTYSDLNLSGNFNSTTNRLSFQYSSSFTLKKGFSIRINGNYYPESVQLQGTTLARYWTDFGVNKKILKEKGSIGFRVSDIFNTQRYNFIGNDLGGYSTSTNNKSLSRVFYISFSYSFGSIKMDEGGRRGGGGGGSIPRGNGG
jgi:iron complex outermembrane receptor protein